ncbi:MAG: 1-acyl-sn-glycerol-3-phosphate acyltransferase, partial [Clostridia bacterium]|nr:1-acyl-sn-glycerol-3-phosphate acyltransferase [Clostridia bacterium]
HKSNFDAIVIDLLFKKRNIYLAKIELFKNKFIGFFMGKFGGIGFDRKKGLSISQTKTVYNLINKKKNIGIFPEGTRKNDFSENEEVKGGACFFAIKTKTPIIPCFITKKHRMFRKNIILVGKPFELTEFYDKTLDREALVEAELILKNNILELKNGYENFLNERKILKKLEKERSKK